MTRLYMDSQDKTIPKQCRKPQIFLPVPCVKEAFLSRLPATDITAKQEASIRVHKNQYYHVSRD
jgi:hypothetical protein